MIVQIKDLKITLGGKPIINGINLKMDEEQQWGLYGPSGSGKSTLAKALAKKIFFRGEIEITDKKNQTPKVILIDQQHKFKNKSNVENFYYQQRFNSADAEDTITVREEIFNEITDTDLAFKWIELFNIKHVLDEPLIQLSNGENKRLQLTKAMLKHPDLLILDNPFIGLDIAGRKILRNALDMLHKMNIKLILIAEPEDMPDCISHLGIIQDGVLAFAGPKQDYIGINLDKNSFKLDLELMKTVIAENTTPIKWAVEMKNVSITYDNKKILDQINWKVEIGDKWCISGPNGSGKSTLLSLITADNPQAYANEISLFDKKRGTGESIWDIKKNIGYLSPEMHLYFDQSITCFQAIASGLFDTIGLFRIPNQEQKSIISKWLSILKIEHLQDRYLNQLSLGEQRLVLLARSLVKSPLLLILDEPCQGLDRTQTSRFKELIDHICMAQNQTLIYVSHYDADIPKSVTKFLRLEKGRILE